MTMPMPNPTTDKWEKTKRSIYLPTEAVPSHKRCISLVDFVTIRLFLSVSLPFSPFFSFLTSLFTPTLNLWLSFCASFSLSPTLFLFLPLSLSHHFSFHLFLSFSHSIFHSLSPISLFNSLSLCISLSFVCISL